MNSKLLGNSIMGVKLGLVLNYSMFLLRFTLELEPTTTEFLTKLLDALQHTKQANITEMKHSSQTTINVLTHHF